MIFKIKDIVKLLGISIIACCAVFVCTIFLNYNLDLVSVGAEITSEAGIAMYDALVMMGKVISGVSGGCLVITSVIMLSFYIKNYVDAHDKELGILKALGYSNINIAKHFWVFGLSAFLGCFLGFIMGFLYLPTFYKQQNAEKLFPEFSPTFQPLLAFLLVLAPTIFFMVISILFAYLKLRKPVLHLLREEHGEVSKKGSDSNKDRPFLKDLSIVTLKSKKALAFFVMFSAFCFSAMVQMSFSMKELSSETFAWMILLIGLILAFVTLFLSLSSVIKGNAKTIAMMRVFGYEDKTYNHAILGVYRPISYIGFAIGTFYQYGLLKIMVSIVFKDIENMPEYHFDFKALAITLAIFIVAYESAMYLFSLLIKKISMKSIMME